MHLPMCRRLTTYFYLITGANTNVNGNDHNHNLKQSRWIEHGDDGGIDQGGRSHSNGLDGSDDENMMGGTHQTLFAEHADGTRGMVLRGSGLSKTLLAIVLSPLVTTVVGGCPSDVPNVDIKLAAAGNRTRLNQRSSTSVAIAPRVVSGSSAIASIL